jgi:16S rRNA (adenine1518-N6/adenine1519-N6)-dimethyltransferase
MKKSRRKALGQHFLTDRSILARIAKVINPQPDDLIIEIGAGKGSLTGFLCKNGARVIAIEKDKTFIPVLKELVFPNLSVMEADVLQVPFIDLTQSKKAKVVGNLPYVISTPILFKVLAEKACLSFCAFLMQKEVAQRISAHPGSKTYAPLSILFQNEFHTQCRFTVSPFSFSPPPKVVSALITLTKRSRPLFEIKNSKLFLRFLKGAFRSRRKKLSNNLKNLNFPDSAIKKAFLMCGIEENLRPEQVSLSQFATLYEELSYLP